MFQRSLSLFAALVFSAPVLAKSGDEGTAPLDVSARLARAKGIMDALSSPSLGDSVSEQFKVAWRNFSFWNNWNNFRNFWNNWNNFRNAWNNWNNFRNAPAPVYRPPPQVVITRPPVVATPPPVRAPSFNASPPVVPKVTPTPAKPQPPPQIVTVPKPVTITPKVADPKNQVILQPPALPPSKVPQPAPVTGNQPTPTSASAGFKSIAATTAPISPGTATTKPVALNPQVTDPGKFVVLQPSVVSPSKPPQPPTTTVAPGSGFKSIAPSTTSTTPGVAAKPTTLTPQVSDPNNTMALKPIVSPQTANLDGAKPTSVSAPITGFKPMAASTAMQTAGSTPAVLKPLAPITLQPLRPDPTIARTDQERIAQAANYARAESERKNLWQPTGWNTGATAAKLNQEKLKHDWDTINLGNAAYSNTLKPGDAVFKGRSDWTVLDVRRDEKTGFLAYSFLNKDKGTIVVGIQGSATLNWRYMYPSDTRRDWNQDFAAYLAGKRPAQFDQAESYVREMKQRYGDRFAVDCVGHSLGGGACAYAASRVNGVHGVAIDPITNAPITAANNYRIDNYVLQGDVADNANRATGRTSPGWYYLVKPDSPVPSVPSVAATTPPTVGPNSIELHDPKRLLQSLGEQNGLKVLELN